MLSIPNDQFDYGTLLRPSASFVSTPDRISFLSIQEKGAVATIIISIEKMTWFTCAGYATLRDYVRKRLQEFVRAVVERFRCLDVPCQAQRISPVCQCLLAEL